jgi:O-antigen/teichoic acid export membrane protein
VSFRRAVAANLLVQSLGPACSFLTLFAIARLAGPTEQGQYAQAKSWVDLLATLGCYGFPQGFIYAINRCGASAKALARWSVVYTAAFAPLALAFSGAGAWLGAFGSGGAAGSPLLLGGAAAALVLYGLWRGVYLTHDAGLRFGIFSIVPSVILLATVAPGVATGWRRFDWMILGSAGPTVAISAAMMRPILRQERQERHREQPWRTILFNGTHSFAQAVLLAAQPVVAYRLVRAFGGADRDVGFLNLGLFLVQGLSVPISMVAPLAFARWTSAADEGLLHRLSARSWRWIAAGIVAGIALALPVGRVVPLIFGQQYRDAVPVVQVMVLTLPLLWYARIVAPALHARSRPGINTAAFAARLGVFAGAAVALPWVLKEAPLAIASAWTIAEAATTAWTLVGLRLMVRAGIRAEERP